MEDELIYCTEDIEKLHLLNELYDQVKGLTNVWVDLVPIAKNIGYEGLEFQNIYKWLKENGLINLYGTGYTCYLSGQGASIVQQFKKRKMTDKELILSLLTQMNEEGQYSIDTMLERMNCKSQTRIEHIIQILIDKELAYSSNWRRQSMLVTYKGQNLTSEEYDELFYEKAKEEIKKIEVHNHGPVMGQQIVHGNENHLSSKIKDNTQTVNSDGNTSTKLTKSLFIWIGTIISGLVVSYIVYKMKWI